MGFLTKPSVKQYDPNPRSVRPLQADISQFLMGQFNGGASPFASATSELQRMSTGGIQQYLNQPAPEQQTFDLLKGGLLGLANQGTAGQITNAALPIFETQLQRQLGGASSAAPGRFSSAFAGQGIDLASRAAQDFNLFQQQAIQQDVQNRLGAGALLGTLAGQAGAAPFQRFLQAGQLGLDESRLATDPQLQLMLAGLGYAKPQGMDTVVGSSPLDFIGQLGGALVSGGGLGGIWNSILGTTDANSGSKPKYYT